MAGDSSLAAPPSPSEVAENYAAWVERGGLSAHTKRAYARQARAFLTWLAEQNRPAALVDAHERDYAVRDYKRWLLGEQRKAPKTVQQALTAIDSLFRWLGLGEADVSRVRIQKSDPKAIGPDETRLVLRAAERRGPRDLALVALILFAGPRIGEVHELNVEDVEIHSRSGWLHIRLGKGDQPRDVPLSLDARQLLAKWLAARRHWPGADTSPALFLSRAGRRLATSSLDRVLDEVGLTVRGELAAATGAPSDFALSAHMLRHTFATDQLAAGVSPATVAEWLGHSDLKTVMVYTRPTRAASQAAIETVRYF